jgi:hypothetical protein
MLRIFTMVAIAITFAGSVRASTISGSFEISGAFTASSNTITWASNSAIADQATIGSVSGSFVGLGNTLAGIENLNFASEPVGTPFTPQDFINLLSAPTFPQLDIDYIAPGTGGPAGCAAAPPAAGQTCTPSGSPFTFLNTAAGVSTVSFNFSGVTSDGKSSWNATFTSQFNESFQNVVAVLDAGGSITSSYSDSNVVIAMTPVPIPGAGWLALTGLLLLAAVGVRLQPVQSRQSRRSAAA